MRHLTEAQRKAMFAKMDGNEMVLENKFSYAPTYAAADIPAMGVDAIGITGASVLPWVPLGVTLGVGYLGADIALKGKNKLQRRMEEEKRISKRLKKKSKKKSKKKKKFSKRPKYDHFDINNMDEVGFYE